jgi:hypothetical protein
MFIFLLLSLITRVGGEWEFPFIERWGKIISERVRDHLLRTFSELGMAVDPEFGRHVIECNPPPIDLKSQGFEGLFKRARERERLVAKVAQIHEVKYLRYGTTPWLDARNAPHSSGERYLILPDFFEQRRGGELVQVGNVITDCSVMASLNSFQCTIEAQGDNDAIEKINRLLRISPLAVALGANGRYLGGVATGFADVRFPAWRRTHPHDPSEGEWPIVGLPKSYYKGLKHYRKVVLSHPLIDPYEPDAFEEALGNDWGDARLADLPNGEWGVEFRPLSLQSSLEGDLALAAFVIGRLCYSQATDESLPPIEKVRRDKRRAERRGIEAFSAQHMLGEIAKAHRGLKAEGLLDPFAKKALRSLETKVIRR